MEIKSDIKLIVLDIDNTVFDWVRYYSHCFTVLLKNVENIVGVSYQKLGEEASEVFEKNGSIEFPFLIQELPSVIDYYGDNIDLMLDEAVEPSRRLFLDEAQAVLKPYEGVVETFDIIKKNHPEIPIAALTDAPRYIAMWKLNKLGILHHFDAVYGLQDPRIPVDDQRGVVKVQAKTLLKHLAQTNFGYKGHIRILPDEYEKPGVRGLKTVLMDYGLDECPDARRSALWVGDHLRKDVGLGKFLGVQTAWASYGAKVSKELLDKLHVFAPKTSIHKNALVDPDACEAPDPDYILKSFKDLSSLFE